MELKLNVMKQGEKCPEKKSCKPITMEGSRYDWKRTIMMLKLPSNSLEKITGTGIRKQYLSLQILTYKYRSRVMK